MNMEDTWELWGWRRQSGRASWRGHHGEQQELIGEDVSEHMAETMS
jgi:hypothetical protein